MELAKLEGGCLSSPQGNRSYPSHLREQGGGPRKKEGDFVPTRNEGMPAAQRRGRQGAKLLKRVRTKPITIFNLGDILASDGSFFQGIHCILMVALSASKES